MKKMMTEFKAFALRGNVMDLAVGVIIGAAFQGVVSSLTENIISPILGIFGEQNFDALVLNIGPLSLRYGAFLTSVINFFIMAFVIFMLVKLMNKLVKKPAPAEKPKPRLCPFCFGELHKDATRCPHCTSQLELEQLDT